MLSYSSNTLINQVEKYGGELITQSDSLLPLGFLVILITKESFFTG